MASPRLTDVFKPDLALERLKVASRRNLVAFDKSAWGVAASRASMEVSNEHPGFGKLFMATTIVENIERLGRVWIASIVLEVKTGCYYMFLVAQVR